jgi:ABC-2 type transport system ATP-binding protein
MSAVFVNRLAKAYGGVQAVRDVSFAVQEGEIFGIVGPNGAGKTTTVECLSGLRRRDGGTVRVLGVDPDEDRAAIRAQVGIQMQSSALPPAMRVGEALALWASFYPAPADPAELMDAFGIADLARRPWRALSGGQRQRLSIALALIGNPRVAILDELTTGLDPAARRATWDLIGSIRDRGLTILLVTHFMDEAERLCDRLAVIDDGQVVAMDTPGALIGRAAAPERMSFRPSIAFRDDLLTGLPSVGSLLRVADRVIVDGSGELVGEVTGALARAGIIGEQLRIEQASLDDAFLAITQHAGAGR